MTRQRNIRTALSCHLGRLICVYSIYTSNITVVLVGFLCCFVTTDNVQARQVYIHDPVSELFPSVGTVQWAVVVHSFGQKVYKLASNARKVTSDERLHP